MACYIGFRCAWTKMEVIDQGAQFFSRFSEVKGGREIMSGDIAQSNT